MAAPLYTTDSGQLWHAGKILVATVGLPARGKTHLSHALERYLRWLGVKTRVFSLGDYRRKVLGRPGDLPSDYFSVGEKSAETEALRLKILEGFDETVMQFFDEEGGQVVIYDANNGQQKGRYALRERFGKKETTTGAKISIMFLEPICNDPAIIEANVRAVKISSPDYFGWDQEKAVQDFYKRIEDHEKEYETIENPSFPYIKLINVGQRIVVNNIQGYLQSRICFFLMNVHNRGRTIYLVRAGEALVEHLYKADADLSSLGWDYAEELTNFASALRRNAAESAIERAAGGDITPGGHVPGHGPGEEGRILEVWTSPRKRAAHTCAFFAERGYKVVERSQLSELNPGVVDGMTAEEIKQRYPDEWEKKFQEPYSHRFPRAESYHDLSVRIEPVIFELERATNDILIVAQSSVLRCLLAYLQGLKPHEIPYIEVHEGELIECSPTAYGVKTTRHRFWDPEAKRSERDEIFFRQQRLGNTFYDDDEDDEDDDEDDDGSATRNAAAARKEDRDAITAAKEGHLEVGVDHAGVPIQQLINTFKSTKLNANACTQGAPR
ncbi:bifunctional 6-phosphofructo-2-kinase/fructose-2,6-bisphosphate 2-phosphatase [Tilletiaria anomala UBC 951]|uniref:Bifunctional 6-phosphofructo-2-kinase/fructose-2,6-bisphosphate 2-phosphatase n=1 Tax=Tilletiaria anomala (strain ATCC 24038 / CBS 436.72 / UBC 951) TaxID=1037660 RepID=A0A066VXT6_TILAU|nr:bifunctional 6-phosphofructo-2-kinase/fructose-2,6-bisphosphate 2-phosphatase [Tilletiaria anomala UBC 951]KDN46291.1 bifunctional 6-phosphofructo-2-kinase/fructose-2,6-bisphosphate 2-phosphatase [Tilletiaria anomala UBC 951]